MTQVARVNDLVVGYCNGPNHTAEREFIGTWMHGSENVGADQLGIVCVGDIGQTDCGHIFIATTGSDTLFIGEKQCHRVGDVVITEGGGVGTTVAGSDTVGADDGV